MLLSIEAYNNTVPCLFACTCTCTFVPFDCCCTLSSILGVTSGQPMCTLSCILCYSTHVCITESRCLSMPVDQVYTLGRLACLECNTSAFNVFPFHWYVLPPYSYYHLFPTILVQWQVFVRRNDASVVLPWLVDAVKASACQHACSTQA